MGRKKIVRPQADEETIKKVKRMIREYPLRRHEIAVYEKSRTRLLRFITVGGEITREELVDAQKYRDAALPTRDKNALLRYYSDREVVYLLQSGMDTVPEGRRKKIAFDKIFGEMNSRQIIEKYAIGYNTYRRAMKEVINYIALFVEEYVLWKHSATNTSSLKK